MRSVVGTHGSYELGAQISAGGIGTIHATDRPEFVYKEYKVDGKAPQLQHLQPLVRIGRQVIVDQRIPVGLKPESSINWPLDIVSTGRAQVAGVILPAIPAQLYHEDHGRPRDLQFLILARSHPPSADARVALLLRMAEIFAYLDSRKLVHGDVSYRNLVWGVHPQPVMYLIDCDGMLPQQPSPTEGVQSLGFADPRVVEGKIPAHDHRSDWYGLALAIYRGLLLRPGNLEKRNGAWPKLSKLPRELDARISDLLRRALDHPMDADGRPAPGEWVAALRDVYLPAGDAWNRKALRALDRVAEKPPHPNTSFTPLPPLPGRPSPTGPRPGQPTAPAHPPTSAWWFPPGPATPPPPPPPFAPPPPPFAPPPPPPRYPVPPPGANPTGARPDAMAKWAMTGISYHLVSLALICCAGPAGWVAGLVIQIIALFQLARAPVHYKGRTGAFVASVSYLVLTLAAMAMFVFAIVQDASQGSDQRPDPATYASPPPER